jgi:hypothetical protein
MLKVTFDINGETIGVLKIVNTNEEIKGLGTIYTVIGKGACDCKMKKVTHHPDKGALVLAHKAIAEVINAG